METETNARRCPHEAATDRWSCYTTEPGQTLGMIETARSECPVAFSKEHDGFYMLLDYRDVKAAVSNHATFSSQPQVLRPMMPRDPVPALEMDPPRHGVWRAVFKDAITARTPAIMEEFVREDVTRHIDSFIGRGSCDLVAELAEPVPAETICRLMGIGGDRVPEIRKRALAMFAAQGDPQTFQSRLEEFGEVVIAEVEERRRDRRDDYLSRLIATEIEGRLLTSQDFVVFMTSFLGAGHHSTTSAISSLVYEVFSRPGLREDLIERPQRIQIAAEEALRLHPPFFGFFRRTTRAVTVAEVDLPEGADVHLGWAAANRDPKMFENPDEFRMDRRSNFHLAFGFGIHTCPGAALARMEMRVVVEELLRRLPDLKVSSEPPTYEFGGGDYAFIARLPATFGSE